VHSHHSDPTHPSAWIFNQKIFRGYKRVIYLPKFIRIKSIDNVTFGSQSKTNNQNQNIKLKLKG